MTKFHHMVPAASMTPVVEEDPTPWFLFVPVVVLDIALFAAVHLNDTLWYVASYAASHVLAIG